MQFPASRNNQPERQEFYAPLGMRRGSGAAALASVPKCQDPASSTINSSVLRSLEDHAELEMQSAFSAFRPYLVSAFVTSLVRSMLAGYTSKQLAEPSSYYSEVGTEQILCTALDATAEFAYYQPLQGLQRPTCQCRHTMTSLAPVKRWDPSSAHIKFRSSAFQNSDKCQATPTSVQV